MKLQYQLNIAFTTLLLVVMAATGYVIYSLILDMLIQDEQRQLEQKGEILVSVLNEQYGTRTTVGELADFLHDQNLQLFLYDRRQDAVLFSTMSKQMADGFYAKNDFADERKNVWEYGNDKFVTSRILFYPQTTGLELILLTPMNDLRAVQHSFIIRLLFVFIIGAFVAVFLSYFMTKKLVTPLSRLRRQLKKIEQRKFDEIEAIEASGEIKEVAQSVYEMAAELQRFINSQQTFFQNASHELKTPLMTIQGYAEGIKERIFDEAETEKGLEVMVNEVNRLKKIINEMILLAKLDSDQSLYRRKKVQLHRLIDQVIDRVKPMATEHHIALDYETNSEITLMLDEEKMLRALLNLVINGVRHAKTKITIKAVQNNGQTIITIEDDGDGVPEELVPHIFHRFVKGKNGETGLGLAIARAIIEQSGGKIAVGKSDLGGAKFTILYV